MLPSLPWNLRSSPLQLSPQSPLSYLCSPPLRGPSPKYGNTFKTLPPAAPTRCHLEEIPFPRPQGFPYYSLPLSSFSQVSSLKGHLFGSYPCHLFNVTKSGCSAPQDHSGLGQQGCHFTHLLWSRMFSSGNFVSLPLETLDSLCFLPLPFLRIKGAFIPISLNIGHHKVSSLALSSCLLHSKYALWLHLFPWLQLPCPCRYVENLYLKSRSSELQI